MAVDRFLDDRCTPKLGAFNPCIPLDVVREAYFSSANAEIEEHIGGASMIGMGIRMANERRENGDVGWAIRLRSDEVMLPASAETRPWARMHTVSQSGNEDLEGLGTSTFVIDALDAPAPLDENDENPEAFSS